MVDINAGWVPTGGVELGVRAVRETSQSRAVVWMSGLIRYLVQQAKDSGGNRWRADPIIRHGGSAEFPPVTEFSSPLVSAVG